MFKNKAVPVTAAVILVFFLTYIYNVLYTRHPSQNNLIKVVLALDWTPNTNHTGLFVARDKGYFKNEGLAVDVLPFSSNVSPDTLVATGKADVGISSTEWVVADKALGAPVKSIAAIIARNTSAMVVLERPDVKSPKDLSGKVYGGYGAPYEEAVVGQIIKTNGGNPRIRNITLDVEALKALEGRKIDFMWAYLGWEGIQAKRDGFRLTAFPITDYGIPDYYSPVFIISERVNSEKKEVLKKFVKALSRGYEFAAKHPEEAAKILIDSQEKGVFPDPGLVLESQKYLSPRYADPGRKWGIQDANLWERYPRFMLESGSIRDQAGKAVKAMDFSSLFTNEFLP